LGARRVVSAGLFLASLGMLITGLAGAYPQAATGRVLTGLGSAAANVPAHTLLALWFSQRRRGLVTGAATSGASLGLIVVGPTIPWVIRSFGDSGWRVAWYVLAAATCFLAIVSLSLLRDRPQYNLEDHEPPLTGAAASWKRLYLSGSIWHLGLIYFFFGFAYMIYMTFFTKRLVADIGYSQQTAGNLFMLLGWASLACGVMWGWISDAVGRKAAVVMIFLIQTVAYALFALWETTAGFALSAVMFGLTAWGIPAIMAAISGDIFGPVMAPAAYGFLTFFHGLGQSTGPYVAGRMADVLPTFAPSYLLAAGVAFLGALGTLALRKRATVHLSEQLSARLEASPPL
ncbi:MAG: MFS transporter, partial [Thermoleophilia bacterium]|nr:MFS transporter [Thermoleophilia bacterium]